MKKELQATMDKTLKVLFTTTLTNSGARVVSLKTAQGWETVALPPTCFLPQGQEDHLVLCRW